MWNRAELKSNAKGILKKNYWWAVLVSLILMLIAGGSNSSSSMRKQFNNNQNKYTYQNDYSDILSDDDFYDYSDDDFYDYSDDVYDFDSYDSSTFSDQVLENAFPFLGIFGGIAASIIFVIVIIAIVLGIFLFMPLQVGCYRWFIVNRTTKPDMSEIVHVFNNGYLNTVKVMFLRNLYTVLWTLLLIIPGFIKTYEYRMIPYLLAENPNMGVSEAFARSKDMMNGNKWDAFVLDLSFIGWEILSAITFGIVGILWVNPYKNLTDTELYVALCGISGRNMDYSSGYGRYDDNTDDDSYNNYTSNPNGSSLRKEMFGNYETGNDYSDQKGIDQDTFR